MRLLCGWLWLIQSCIDSFVILSSSNLTCGRNRNHPSTLGSPEWLIDPSCHETTNLEWKSWNSNVAVRLHEHKKVYPTQVCEVIIPGKPLSLSSNRLDEPHLQRFTPASTAIISACFKGTWTWGSDADIRCRHGYNMKVTKQEDICIYAETFGYARLFQHYYINTSPIRGLASEIQRRFYPNATLVARWSMDWEKDGAATRMIEHVNCRVLLFVTPHLNQSSSLLIPPPSPTTWDCFWYGSFDHLKEKPLPSQWGGQLNSTTKCPSTPYLFVYADRLTRTPHPTDNSAFQSSLRDIAQATELTYHLLADESSAVEKANIFSCAKVVVAVHGGALANMAFMDPDSVVIEIQPISGGNRFCFLCMAYGLGISHYGVYFEERWTEWYYTTTFSLDVTAIGHWIHNFLQSKNLIPHVHEEIQPEGNFRGYMDRPTRRLDL
jgi:hypothetical protein